MPNQSVAILTLKPPDVVRDGGTLRLRAYRDAFDRLPGYVPRYVLTADNFAAAYLNSAEGSLVRELSALKRYWLPMPTKIGSTSGSVRDELHRLSPDLLLVSMLSQLSLVRSANARLWLDFMDVWSEVALREADSRALPARLTSITQAHLLRRQELRGSRAAAVVTTAGWAEHASLRRRGIDSRWLPTPLPDDEFVHIPRRGTTLTVGFLANFSYWSNRQALKELMRVWYPRLREWRVPIIIAGIDSQYAIKPVPAGVDVLGQIHTVNEFYSQIDLALAPVVNGGGMKVKILEALTRGRPVVATPHAIEGLPPNLQRWITPWESITSVRELQALAGSPQDGLRSALHPFQASSFEAQVQAIVESGIR